MGQQATKVVQICFALLYGTLNTCFCYECMCGGANVLLCPASLGHPLGRGASTIVRYAQMQTWAMHKCWVAGWLAIAANRAHLQIYVRCTSHTVTDRAKDSPSHKATMPRLATLSPTSTQWPLGCNITIICSYCPKHPNDQPVQRVA